MITLLRKTVYFLLWFLLWLIAGAWLLTHYSKGALLLFANGHYYPSGDFFFPYWTHFGDGFTYVVIIGIFLWLKKRWEAWLAFLGFAISSIVSFICKTFFFSGAERPAAYFQHNINLIHQIPGVELFTANSFPSGHTITAFSIGVLLTYLAKDKRWSFVFFFLACSVGYSRMYLAEHFFADIYGGSIIGVVTTLFAIALGERYMVRWTAGKKMPWVRFEKRQPAFQPIKSR